MSSSPATLHGSILIDVQILRAPSVDQCVERSLTGIRCLLMGTFYSEQLQQASHRRYRDIRRLQDRVRYRIHNPELLVRRLALLQGSQVIFGT